jgi:sterol desaturase/sphingolipid hydroxylase (fatty acid hydroxylase superfamily)
MIFYLLGILGYYKLRKQPVPMAICLAFFAVITIPPGTTLYLLMHKHWIFQLLAFAGGLFCWTFVEYFMHRFLMHGRENKQYHESSHFHHHKEPNKLFVTGVKRLLLTISALALIGCTIFFSPYLALPAGILTGFSIYTYMHLWLHKRWATRWMGMLQRFHMQHHCGHPDTCYGVISTWWDHLFGTVPQKNTEITEKKLVFYFNGKKEKEAKIISLGSMTDEKLNWDEKQSA